MLILPETDKTCIRAICTRAALVACGRYMLGDLTGSASATDFHHEYDLQSLTDQERAVLTGDAA